MTTQLNQQIAEKAKGFATQIVQSHFYPDIQAKGSSEQSEIFQENLSEDLPGFVSLVAPLIISERDREWREEIIKFGKMYADSANVLVLLLEKMEGRS